MKNESEFVEDFLAHYASQYYDPVKAREYYLRTRKLKGRSGASPMDSSGRSSANPSSGTPSASPMQSSAEERRRKAEQRVAEIRQRLDRLKAILADLVEQAKARSGVESKPTAQKVKEASDTKKESKKSKETPERKLSEKEKREARERSRENYEKQSKSSTSATERSLLQEKDAIERKIAEIRKKLKAAVEKERRLNGNSSAQQMSSNRSLTAEGR